MRRAVCHNSGKNMRMCAPLSSGPLTANPGFSGRYIVFPGPVCIPAPEPHERAQPLQFEALNARNAGNNAITGMSTAAFDPTGGVPQPAPFPIAKSVLSNPIADPGADINGNSKTSFCGGSRCRAPALLRASPQASCPGRVPAHGRSNRMSDFQRSMVTEVSSGWPSRAFTHCESSTLPRHSPGSAFRAKRKLLQARPPRPKLPQHVTKGLANGSKRAVREHDCQLAAELGVTGLADGLRR